MAVTAQNMLEIKLGGCNRGFASATPAHKESVLHYFKEGTGTKNNFVSSSITHIRFQ